jgi:cytochrome b561
MKTEAENSRASLALRSLHWLMAVAVAAALVFIYAKGLFPKGAAERHSLTGAHMSAGLAVLALLPWRVVVRFLTPLPAIDPAPALWQMRVARMVHGLLYGCLLAMPVLGVLSVQAGGKEVSMLGFVLPSLVGMDRTLSHNLREIHETLGTAMLYLVVIHVGAALWHHVFQRDNTLRRML